MKALRFFILTLMLFAFVGLQAQNKALNHIELLMGPSFPTGDFQSTETGTLNNWNNTAGFAKTGYSINLEAAFYFLPKLGIQGSLAYSDHGRLSSSDISKLGASFTDAFGVDETTVTAKGRYRAITLLAGPCYSIPEKKFTIDLDLMGGLLKSISTPEITVQLEDVSEFRQNSSTASAFGVQAGAGIRYELSQKISLAFRTDYFYSGGVDIENENRSNNAGRMVTKQPMSWLNTSLGLVYNFNIADH